MKSLHVHSSIEQASTLPAAFYTQQDWWELAREKIFARSWQYIGDEDQVPLSPYVYPFEFMESYLPEPLLLSRTKAGALHCLSNVCTHRGNLVVDHPGQPAHLLCKYHGRRFNLEGKFEHMPEFKDTDNFPRHCEDLHQISLRPWHQLLFAHLGASPKPMPGLDIMQARIGFLPVQDFQFSPERSRDYLVNAHWALYCDNYLEGFHIPFVHNDLNQAIDYGTYTTELFEEGVLQIGYGKKGTETFQLPPDHPDAGKEVAAYYYWLFPNIMFNFYPWGLSLNIVRPLGLDKCRVSFRTYLWDESKIAHSAGALLDKVEREDEVVVESVQKGLRSRFYPGGRFSPSRETGVHHFHRLIEQFMANEA
jgi:choline monooxygenase